MKNFQKIALGLVVGATAFGFSAFTSVRKAAITENFLVQRVSNQITPLTGTASPSKCFGTATLECIYNVTPDGKANIPSLASLGQTFYTPAQISSYLTHSPAWLTIPSGSQKAVYVP